MPGEIDKTGETLTPEQAQASEGQSNNAQKTEDVESKAKAEAEAKARADADAKAAEEAKAKAEADAKAEDESDKTPPVDPLQKKRSMYDDYKEKKNEAKESKAEADRLLAENKAKDAKIAELNALVEASKTAKTKEEKEDVAKDIAEFAESIGADAAAVDKLEKFLKKRLTNTEDVGITKADVEFVKKFREDQAKTQATTEFQKEWSGFVPSLKKEFPHVSDEELASVQSEVDKLAHTAKYHDKEIDYIYFKEKEKLSKLISPKQPSYESGGGAKDSGEKISSDLSGSSSPMDVQNAIRNDKAPQSLEIRSSQ